MRVQRFLHLLSILIAVCAIAITTNRLYKASPVQPIPKNNENTLRTLATEDARLSAQAVSGGYIRQRSIQNYKITNLLLASDIQGGLHALNRDTGEKMWSIEGDGPLVQISSNFSLYDRDNKNDDESLNDEMIWIVEPYADGNLYFFTKKLGLNRLPVSISTLVLQSPFALGSDEKIYTGIRKSSLYTIDIISGEIVQSYGSSCQGDPVECASDSSVVLIGKTTYELTIHSKNDVSWNVTYSTWGPNTMDNDLVDQNKYPLDGTYVAPFHDSTILAIDMNTKIAKWVSQLPDTIVNVFDVLNDFSSHDGSFVTIPHPLKAPQGFNDYESKGTYLDTTSQGSWFAMSSDFYPSLVQSAPTSRYSLSERYRSAANHLLSNEELHKIIVGVHPLPDSDVGKYPIEASLGYPTNFPSNDQLIEARPIQRQPQDYTPDSIRPGPYAKYNSRPASRLGLPSEPYSSSTRHPTPGFLNTVVGKFLLRCFENIMMLVILGLIGYVAIKMKWIPSLKTLLKKNGLELKELEPVEVKISSDVVDNTFTDAGEGQETQLEVPLQKEIESTEAKYEVAHTEGIPDEKTGGDKAVEKEALSTFEEKLLLVVEDDNFEKPKKEVRIVEPDDKVSDIIVKKRKRGSRGGKRSRRNFVDNSAESTHSPQDSISTPDDALIKTASIPQGPSSSNGLTGLTISQTVLGYGSYGTVVFKGTFQNRDVAIKRMLIDFYDVASQEIKLLTESDDHPNVIRYFYSETNDRFLYIALELCSASLEDVVEKSYQHQELSSLMNPVNVLEQIAKGLHHLHSLKIVHRDIKPQNILVAPPKKLNTRDINKFSPVRILISDFGLCKKLEADESSFKATTQHAAGTSGWRAPELLLENSNIANLNHSINSEHSLGTSTNNSLSEALAFDFLTNRKLTRAIDIFSLGCVFYYILTNGSHPFGDRYLREGNVIKNQYCLDQLEILPENVEEAKDLINKMISRNPKARPSTEQVLKHPFFWSSTKKLEFLLKVSDRFEVEPRNPPSELLEKLEATAEIVTNGDWCAKFDKLFMDNLGAYRKYWGHKLMDLLRALRNKHNHFNDMPPELSVKMTPLPDGFYQYFNRKFPNMLMQIYYVVQDNLKEDPILKSFF